MNSDAIYIAISKEEEKFINLIQSTLGFKFEGTSTHSSSQEDGPMEITLKFPTKNARLSKTDYFLPWNKEENKLLHFTSLKTLYSIINDKAIRLYNLHNSNDKNEYKYASDQFYKIFEMQGISKSVYDDIVSFAKRDSFILSTTDIRHQNNMSFWCEYGDKYQGVAIELEIVNDPKDWEFSYFSKIKYNELDKKFSDLISEWENLQRQNIKNKYFIELHQLLSLHKSKEYKREEEIRILLRIELGHTDASLDLELFKDDIPLKKDKNDPRNIYKRNVFDERKIEKIELPIQYFKLPIYLDSEHINNTDFFKKGFWSKIPKIKISNIYFGPKFPAKGQDFLNFRETIKDDIYKRLGYNLNLPRNPISLDDSE